MGLCFVAFDPSPYKRVKHVSEWKKGSYSWSWVSGYYIIGKGTYLQVRHPDRDLSLAWDNRSFDGILVGRRGWGAICATFLNR